MPADESSPNQAAWVSLARILRPQGRKGEVFAEILTDFPEKFAERRRLWLVEGDGPARKPVARPAPKIETQIGAQIPAARVPGLAVSELPLQVELKAHWLHKGGVVLHFAGVDSISAAEALVRLVVAIPRAERAALEEGEAYISDLIGCALVDVAGGEPVRVGEIEDVDRSAGPVPLLVVGGEQGEILVPWAKDYLRRIDLDGRRVEMALPEGLTGLNLPERS
jgi:16S rRNA processing protein RimM